MAIITSSAAAFDNLSPLPGTLTSAASDSVAISFAAAGAKLQSTLKLYGSFDAQGNAVSLTNATCVQPDAQAVSLAFPSGTAALTLPASTSLRVDHLLAALLTGDDWFTLGAGADRVDAGGGDDYVNGGAGGDLVRGAAGNDVIAGGDGLDTALYAGPRSRYAVAATGSGFTVTDQSGAEGADQLGGIERLQFSDARVALDLDGHAGQVAKILGAVFGAKAVGNREFVGIGLQLMDEGMGYEALAALAVGAAGQSAPEDVVRLLWSNVIGSTPSAQDIQPFVELLTHGTSIGQLTVLAADTPFNTANIDLTGLAKSGIDYIAA